MSNGEVCCITGVCCPPDARVVSLSKALCADGVCEPPVADAVAAWLAERFDFAPKGLLQPLLDYAVVNARRHPPSA